MKNLPTNIVELTGLEQMRRQEAPREPMRDAMEHRAAEILESITDAFFALGPDWRFTYLNRQAQRILGRTSDELVGTGIWDSYPAAVGTEFERVYKATMASRVAASFTAFYADHDCWYEVHAYPASGGGLSVYFRDVTQRMRADAERQRLVEESETQRLIYEVALSNTPDLVYVFDLDHRFIYANAALLKMWGRESADAIGKTCLELGYEPWHAEMHDREIEQVIATRQPIRGEVPFAGTGGRRIYDYIFTPVLGADGAVVAIAGTTRDVTERQQSEQEIRQQAAKLRESDQAKDEFLATLAHELRNPLAPISNCLELLKRAGGNADLATRARGTMERQVRHLVRLVDDLLDVSRITRGRLELRTERVELSAIVEQSLESCRMQIETAGHELTVALVKEPLFVDADPVRMVQVLCNLLTNAAKYTPRGGRVDLSVDAHDGHVEIKVSDTGIGIAHDMMARVFDMFVRVDHALERSQDGLGIGLTLAKRLVALHGGTLDAHSEGLGRGSEFTVRLPLSTGASAGDDPPRAAPR